MDTRHATGDTLKHGAENILKKKPMYVGTTTLLTLAIFIFVMLEFVSLSFRFIILGPIELLNPYHFEVAVSLPRASCMRL